MNLYTTLTFRYLKENKKRTIVTIIGIILSTALICGIGNISNSFMDYQYRETIKSNGDFHATFYNVDKRDLSKITKSAGISKYAYSKTLGFGKYDDEKFLLEIKAYNKDAFKGYQITLKEGQLPINNKEIVVSEDSQLLKYKKIGDKITLNVGKRVNEDGDILTDYWIDDNEKLIDTHKDEYKIVGIINKPGFEFGKQVTMAITYLDINSMNDKESVNVSISANKPKEIYSIASVITNNLDLNTKDTDSNGNFNSDEKDKAVYNNLKYNENLLRLQNASFYDNINNSIVQIVIFVTSLVIICTIATVYNAFSISISERKKQFGILNSIGATKGQTIKLVLIEAFIVSIIGIPFGLISGTFAIDILFKIISSFYSNSMIGELGLRVVYNPNVIILSTIIVIITILISAILPARQAAKISPLEAIKNSSNLKITKVKDSKIVRKLFKAEGVLAYKNLRRNKNKFRITLFSLIISVVIFISFSGFMNLYISATKVQYGQQNYDLNLYSSSKIDEKSLEELKNIDGINRIAAANYYGVGVYVPENKINKQNKELINNSGYFSIEDIDNKSVYNTPNGLTILPGDFEINKINLKEGSFDKKEAIKENGVILVRKSYYEEPGKKYELELTDYKVGDTVKFYTSEYDEEKDKEIKKEFEVKIMAITDDIPTGSSQYNYMGLDFITYDEVGKKFGFDASTKVIYVTTNGEEATKKAVKDIAKRYGYDVTDKEEEVKAMEDTLMIMQVFVYGFVTVISLVSITNIVNTISTNINLRKRELAIIKSIGVTPKGFNKMVYLESLLYGALSLIYGIPIGICLVILMNKILGQVIQFGLVLPWSAIIISIAGIFVITFISAYIPMRKINKENIIENIRQESI